jgi:spore coat protein CotF
MPNHQSGGSQGQQSSMQSSSSSSSQSSSGKVGQSGSGQESSMGSFLESDKLLCTDMLDTEKYVSGSYNTAIFEFRDPQIRDVLNHIQKDEQKHGEAIFKYMESCGMYSTQ